MLAKFNLYRCNLVDMHSWHLPGHVAEDGAKLDTNPGDHTVASMKQRVLGDPRDATVAGAVYQVERR